MLGKLTRKALSFLMAVMLVVASFSTTAQAAKPGGGGGSNSAPVISLVSIVPSELTEDTTTSAVITLSANDKERNQFTWSIQNVTLGKASLQGTINPIGKGTIKVNYTASANANGTAVITVQAKDTLGAANLCQVSIVIKPVNDAPVCQVLPSISGTADVGQTLSAANGTWSDVEKTPLTYAYQWQLADSSNGTNKIDIAGATTNAYTIASTDSGKYIRVSVTATDGGDNGTAPLSTTAYSAWVMVGQTVPQPQEAQYYVALGDSIAAGTNNANLLGTSYRYTNTFSSELAAIYSNTSYGYKNDAFPGDTTDDLLSKLQTDSTIISDASKATIITISIGGNNVLSSTSPEGYSQINDAQATAGVNDFALDLPAIVDKINALHSADHLPQIYIMDMYNLFHPWERGTVLKSSGTEEGFMHELIAPYLQGMQTAIDSVASANTKVYRVNTYDAFENYPGRFAITDPSHVKTDPVFGSYFFSSYIEDAAVYSDCLTRFDIYPYVPIMFDYINLDHYRDPHPDELGHNLLKDMHLAKFKEVNGLK